MIDIDGTLRRVADPWLHLHRHLNTAAEGGMYFRQWQQVRSPGNGCRNNFRVGAHRFVVSLNSLGNSQPATARQPSEFKETTNGVRIGGSRADVRNREAISCTLRAWLSRAVPHPSIRRAAGPRFRKLDALHVGPDVQSRLGSSPDGTVVEPQVPDRYARHGMLGVETAERRRRRLAAEHLDVLRLIVNALHLPGVERLQLRVLALRGATRPGCPPGRDRRGRPRTGWPFTNTSTTLRSMNTRNFSGSPGSSQTGAVSGGRERTSGNCDE